MKNSLNGLALLTLAGASLLLSGCGSTTSQSDLDRARAQGAAQQVQTDAQASIAADVQAIKTKLDSRPSVAPTTPPATGNAPGGTSSASAGQSSCGSNVSVGGSTSCAFGQNVATAFYNAGGGTRQVEVYSPTTGLSYSMNCVAGIPTVCRGGNDAVVYIR